MTTIGIIGLGSIGLRHAKSLLAMGHEVYGFDPDIERLGMLIKVGGINGDGQNPYSGYDGYVVASPTHMHIEHLQWCINAGHPVLVEKPIADQKIVIGNHPIMVGVNQRYHPCVQQAREWLKDGLIGAPRFATFSVLQYNKKYKDSVILNWGAHEVDLALYLLGGAKVAQCKAEHKGGIETVATIMLEHSSGVESSICLDYLTKPQKRWFSIKGDQGAIACDLERFTASIAIYQNNISDVVSLPGSMDDTYVDEMQEFLRRIDGKKPDGIGATGEEGLACLKLLLEAQKLAAGK